MPSSKKARQAIMQLADKTGTGSIVDLGSGWGSLVIRLAIKYPDRKIIGYELSVIPWLATMTIKRILGIKNLDLYRQDYLTADLSGSAVIVCYLFPAGMSALENKLALEKMPIDFLISNNFALPSHQPINIIELDDLYRSPVYLYQIIS